MRAYVANGGHLGGSKTKEMREESLPVFQSLLRPAIPTRLVVFRRPCLPLARIAAASTAGKRVEEQMLLATQKPLRKCPRFPKQKAAPNHGSNVS